MANKLINCKSCGAEMTANAKTCPQCGTKNKKPIFKKWWFWVLIVVIIGAIAGGGSSANKSSENTETMQEDARGDLIDISLDVIPNVNSDDGTVLFGITTNLPEDTELLITVSNEDGYTAQDKAVILNNGTGYTSEFSDNGKSLKGDYIVDVTMSLPKLQKESVQAVIGENGEKITGKYVKKDDITGANIVRGEFPFNFPGVAQEEPAQKESVSIEFQNALKKAQSYCDLMNMSKQGIYDQLTSEYGEQFPADAAQYAIDNINADWNANALAKAKDYQSMMSMSKNAIYDQLTSEYGEQFTAEEAQYAVDHLDD